MFFTKTKQKNDHSLCTQEITTTALSGLLLKILPITVTHTLIIDAISLTFLIGILEPPIKIAN